MDSILAKQAELAERELHFFEPGLDVVEPLLTEARERATGERSSLPSQDDIAALLAVVDGLQVLLKSACRDRDDARSMNRSLLAANDELRSVVDHLLRSEVQQSGGSF